MTDIYEQIFNSAMDPMLLILDDKIEKINPVFCKILGYEENELIGKPFLRFVVKKPEVAEIYLKRMKGGKTPVVYETEIITKKNRTLVNICGTMVEINGAKGIFAILKL